MKENIYNIPNDDYYLKKELYSLLKKDDQIFDFIQHVCLDGLWFWDLENPENEWMNPVFWKTLGYNPDEMPHNSSAWQDIINKDDLQLAINNLHKHLSDNNYPYDQIVRYRHKKGHTVWIRCKGKAIRDENEKPIRMLGVHTEITSFKNNEFRYKSLIEGTNIGIWEWNIQTGETVFNEQWASIVGYTLDELSPISKDTFTKLAHPDDREAFHKILNACFDKKQEFYECEIRMKHKDGHWVWVYDRGKVVEWTDDGKPLLMYGTHQDITTQKKREDDLRISEEAFRGNFENAAIGMAIISLSGQWLRVNREVCEIVGYQEEELMTLTFQDITHPEDLDADLSLLNELIAGKRGHYQIEKRYLHKKGHIVHIILAVSVVKDSEGKILYFISQIIDISDRKNQEQEIAYQQDLLLSFYQNAPIGIALNDYETGKFIDVNDKLIEPTGYTKEEFTELSYWDVTPREYERLEVDAIKQMNFNGRYEIFEKEYIRKDGSKYPISLQGVMVTDTKDKKLIWSFVRDISHEKDAERNLKEAISKLQAILDASRQVSIIATDIKGKITLFNSGAEQMLCYKAEELVGKLTPLFFHLNEEIELEGKRLSETYVEEINGFDVLVHESQNGHHNTKQWTYIKKDGLHIIVLTSVNTIIVDGIITGYLIVATDITKLKNVEKEIRSLLSITEEQNGRLKNFAHIVSHNLRSHSGGINALIDLLLFEHPNLIDTEILTLVRGSIAHLRQTVEDLTEIVKVNLSNEELRQIQLLPILDKNLTSLSSHISKTGIKIINEIPDTIRVKGIVAYLDSIILNLITNAIKYRSEDRESYLKIYCEEDNSTVTLFFQDNGLGIDLKKYGDKLFGMYKTFHRHDDSRGVGLFLTKNQVESIGGKITVESKVNIGSKFIINFKK